MGAVYVYAAAITPLRDAAAYDAAYHAASAARREKVDRLARYEDRLRSLAAERLLRYALGQCGVSGDAALAYGAHGKPYAPQYPQVHFNLSHAGEYVLCAVSDADIGCDIEAVGEPRDAVARRWFTPREYAAVQQDGVRFFRIWTLKESFLKATGEGLTLGMDAVDIGITEDGVSVRQTYDRRAYAFWESGAIEGYRIAVCRVGEPFETIWEQVEI